MKQENAWVTETLLACVVMAATARAAAGDPDSTGPVTQDNKTAWFGERNM